MLPQYLMLPIGAFIACVAATSSTSHAASSTSSLKASPKTSSSTSVCVASTITKVATVTATRQAVTSTITTTKTVTASPSFLTCPSPSTVTAHAPTTTPKATTTSKTTVTSTNGKSATTTTSACPTYTNIITDGDFETGTLTYSPWHQQGQAEPYAYVVVDKSAAYSGLYGLLVQFGDAGTHYPLAVTQQTRSFCPPGTDEYAIGFQYNISPGCSMVVTVNGTQVSDVYGYTSGWALGGVPISAQSAFTLGFEMRNFNAAGTTSTGCSIYLDDVSTQLIPLA